MKKIIIFYAVLAAICALCIAVFLFDTSSSFLIDYLLSGKEITRISVGESRVWFYFNNGNTSIAHAQAFAFCGAIITLIVAILLTVIILVARKIKDNRAIEEELRYQRFKERMEREKRR